MPFSSCSETGAHLEFVFHSGPSQKKSRFYLPWMFCDTKQNLGSRRGDFLIYLVLIGTKMFSIGIPRVHLQKRNHQCLDRTLLPDLHCMLAALNLLAWHGGRSQQDKCQNHFSLLPLEDKRKSYKRAAKLFDLDRLRANTQFGHCLFGA